MKKFLIPLMLLTLFTGCKEVKEAIKMPEKMDKLGETTDGMSDTTSQLYSQLRSAQSSVERRDAFALILNDNIEMGQKLTNAAKFFMAFEYNLYTGIKPYDNLEIRDMLFYDAVEEFYKNMASVYETDIKGEFNVKKAMKKGKMTPIHTGKWSLKKRNYEQSFYAVAAALHKVHHRQTFNAKNNGFAEMSMYTLMKDALIKDSQGATLSKSEEYIVAGHNREISIALLKARIDIILALAINDSMDADEASFWPGLLHVISGGKLGKLELPSTFETSNAATMHEANKKIEEALKCYDFLLSIGVKHEIDKKVKNIFDNVELPELDNIQAQNDNIQEYREYIQQIQKID
ncbi:hypothetical protein ABMA70_02565 [Halobacteriovorax sp. XZX-3]|uniref:hypothetical protein n=1 Tax=unclassified Halobacteriovorax TaxID=2639665 RepID=UPI000CD1566F|nr:hypothetical protein [Halobacteriovorax sp. DA5]POB14624.1 hypothetical protein C0Z22_05890 [Halobacteriovorax sp. DA5]